MAVSSTIDSVLSNTIGVGWRAVSGTVDPWTKQEAVDSATDAYIQAGMDPNVAGDAASKDITEALTTFSYKGFHDADPSNFLSGVEDSINKAGGIGSAISQNILYIGLGIGILFLVYIGFENRSLLRG